MRQDMKTTMPGVILCCVIGCVAMRGVVGGPLDARTSSPVSQPDLSAPGGKYTFVKQQQHKGEMDGKMDSLVPSSKADFSVSRGSFNFVYHDQHNLLLTKFGNRCFFSYINDGHPTWGQGNSEGVAESILLQHPSLVQEAVIQSIIEGHYTTTTMGDVRAKYEDLLADYHCAHRELFDLSISPILCTRG